MDSALIFARHHEVVGPQDVRGITNLAASSHDSVGRMTYEREIVRFSHQSRSYVLPGSTV